MAMGAKTIMLKTDLHELVNTKNIIVVIHKDHVWRSSHWGSPTQPDNKSTADDLGFVEAQSIAQ